MIIGIDIRILAPGKRTGIVEYTEQLVGRMIMSAPEHRFKLFYSSFRKPLPDYPWLAAPNVELHARRIPNNLLFLLNSLFDWPKLDVLIGGADVFFMPHMFIASLSKDCRRVTTFHDLSYLRFPEFFTVLQRLWHVAEMNPAWQARRSDAVIAVSESTKTDVVRYYDIDPANIKVVYSASNLRRPPPENLEEFKIRHGLPDRFVFSVGTLSPRKNIVGVIRSFNQLKELSGFDDVQLIIAGDRGWLHEEIFAEIARSPYRQAIRYAGYVSDEDRAQWYAASSIFVYPSFFEGFGLPILEAMACRTPVVTSLNSSLPEVAGNAALLVDPYRVSDITAAINGVLTDAALWRRLHDAGLANASRFSWERTAAETLGLLARV